MKARYVIALEVVVTLVVIALAALWTYASAKYGMSGDDDTGYWLLLFSS